MFILVIKNCQQLSNKTFITHISLYSIFCKAHLALPTVVNFEYKPVNTVNRSCLGIGGQCVELALVPENGMAESGHHDANGPAGVALQLDDLVRTAVNMIKRQ